MERRRLRPSAAPLVLIVDETREPYAVALASLGFETTMAAGGAHAFEIAWHVIPDLIVMEVSLPRFDGWGLIEDLKGDPQTWDIPIVMLTREAESSVRERATQQGCAAVLVKPCRPEALAQTLREVLGRPAWSANASIPP